MNSIAKIATYLNTASDGTSPATPVSLPVVLSLASDWANLLDVINTAGKYVALDLSTSTMTGMTNTAGEFGNVLDLLL